MTDCPFRTRPGSRFPPGATAAPGGVNFCVFSRYANSVELLLYADGASLEPLQTIRLAPEVNRTFFFWHVFVEGLEPGVGYAWRVDGPSDTDTTGRAFDHRKLLLDPWARAVGDALWDRRRVIAGLDPGRSEIRAIVTEPLAPPAARAPPRGLEGAIVYELHVGGFTRDPSSGVRNPGTFAGLIEKIPYLQELGITHVELLPVMAYDEQDVPDAAFTRGLRNYWGYSTHSFFSPHPRYCVQPAHAAREFRALTDAFHAAGIGVLLDVAFNHTAEGGTGGPVINFKGLANDVFYHLDATDKRRYRDYTGCGNTVNCNHPLVTGFIVHSLEYWVEQLGADGFRFDLASVFTRGQDGGVMADPPVPWAIESSRTLAPVPVVAEAWDAAGLYHVGAFPGMAWAEWNGLYRDVMRRFMRGEPGLLGAVASRIAGSADLYADDGRLPCNSVNFITCHDGFTLRDLVSYSAKHNATNGEENRDGSNDNLSCNHGVEGETTDAAVTTLRDRQAKNHVTLLMLSRGVPMLLAGDEVLRTQRGNNNAYSQDNAISWFDWRLVESRRSMLRFVREVIALRRRHPCLTNNRFFHGRPVPGRDLPDITWHGARLHAPGWGDPHGRMLAVTIAGSAEEEDLHVILNMSEAAIEVELPQIANRTWHVAIDTTRESPLDVVERARQIPYAAPSYCTNARSIVALEAR